MNKLSYTITTTNPVTARCLISFAELLDGVSGYFELLPDTSESIHYLLSAIPDATMIAEDDEVRRLVNKLRDTADRIEKNTSLD